MPPYLLQTDAPFGALFDVLRCWAAEKEDRRGKGGKVAIFLTLTLTITLALALTLSLTLNLTLTLALILTLTPTLTLNLTLSLNPKRGTGEEVSTAG